jgi:hypothetical protein
MGRGSNDSKVYRVTPPWVGSIKHFYQEFDSFIVTLMREMLVRPGANPRRDRFTDVEQALCLPEGDPARGIDTVTA